MCLGSSTSTRTRNFLLTVKRDSNFTMLECTDLGRSEVLETSSRQDHNLVLFLLSYDLSFPSRTRTQNLWTKTKRVSNYTKGK